jgi:O-acetyl-ADP-ribose deacetylase (regulator of RNase III)
VGGFPVREAARIMLDVVKAHLAGSPGLEIVVFALHGEESYQAFQKELESAE